jgi:hypothetical protein
LLILLPSFLILHSIAYSALDIVCCFTASSHIYTSNLLLFAFNIPIFYLLPCPFLILYSPLIFLSSLFFILYHPFLILHYRLMHEIGLRKMNSESEEVLAILEFLTRKTVECKEVFNCMCVGNCLNGLQGMSSENKIVLELLRALVLKVAKSPEELTSITIGSALMGVRRMDTVTAEVRTLLAILALKINDSKTVLDPISFSMAFNGLRCMDESSVEMRALLGTLADKADVMPHETLTPSILSNAMSGLRRIKGECYESRQVVTAILKKLGGPSEVSTGDAEASNVRTWKHISIGQFNSLDIGRSLYGLQSMSPESCPEVRPLLERLALSIRSSKGPLYARDAGLALYGLRSHTEQSAESTAIVGGIAERLALSKDSFNSKSASMALMGVQGLSSDSAAVCDILTVIKDRVGPFDSQVNMIISYLTFVTHFFILHHRWSFFG